MIDELLRSVLKSQIKEEDEKKMNALDLGDDKTE